jgi:flagellar motor switch protein FliN
VPDDKPLNRWLVEEFGSRLGQVFESMAGQRPALEIAGPQAPSATAGAHVWKQPYANLDGALWIVAAEADWTVAGTHILAAAGLGPEDCDAESTRSSYVETLTQALGGVGQAFTSRLGREVTPKDGAQIAIEEFEASTKGVEWFRLDLALGDKPAALFFGMAPALLAALQVVPEPAKPAAETQLATNASAAASQVRPGSIDLLLDVELPISVSFGKADVALKEVLKLTTGSIVELNRTILEPVDVIVNNCVIARGEVVVIEGNFGVRIKQVISRQERIRTLR